MLTVYKPPVWVLIRLKVDGEIPRFDDGSAPPLGQGSRDTDPAHWGLSSQKGKQMLKRPKQEGQRARSFSVQKTQPHHLPPVRLCSALLRWVTWSWWRYRRSEMLRGSSKVSAVGHLAQSLVHCDHSINSDSFYLFVSPV